MSDDSNPCITCGACCARFPVLFYSEDDVPKELSYETDLYERKMKTKLDSENRPRCVALRGELGGQVACGIYEKRPQPCRNFKYSYEDGGPRNERCDEARIAIGLRPLSPK